MLPDNRHLLFLVTSSLPGSVQGIWVASIDNPSDRRRLLGDLAMPQFSGRPPVFRAGRHIDGATVRRGKTGAHVGEAVPAFDRVDHFANTGYGAFSTAKNGTITRAQEATAVAADVVRSRRDLAGRFGAAGRYQWITLSPDDKARCGRRGFRHRARLQAVRHRPRTRHDGAGHGRRGDGQLSGLVARRAATGLRLESRRRLQPLREAVHRCGAGDVLC